jgi:hypothetical protein
MNNIRKSFIDSVKHLRKNRVRDTEYKDLNTQIGII